MTGNLLNSKKNILLFVAVCAVYNTPKVYRTLFNQNWNCWQIFNFKRTTENCINKGKTIFKEDVLKYFWHIIFYNLKHKYDWKHTITTMHLKLMSKPANFNIRWKNFYAKRIKELVKHINRSMCTMPMYHEVYVCECECYCVCESESVNVCVCVCVCECECECVWMLLFLWDKKKSL